MGNVKQLLAAVQMGELAADDAGPAIARLITATAARNSAEVDGLRRVDVVGMRMAGSLDEADRTDTFLDVEVAHVLGKLTDEQYGVIRSAVLGEGR